MRKCPNGHEVSDNVKFCPQCGAEVVDNNQEFCSNCGSVRKENEKFCSHCGTPFGNVPNNPPINDEEEKKGGFKKYLPYIIGVFALLVIFGYIFSNGSSEEQLNNTEASKYTEEDIKKSIEDMYNDIFNSTSNDGIDDDVKYTSSEYQELNSIAAELSEDMYLSEDHWIQGQDCDNPSMKVISVKKEADDRAVAKVSIKQFKQSDSESQVTLKLVFEDGKWVVDDFISKFDGEDWSEKSYLADLVKELQSKPKEENLDWLQGHWVYERGSYKGHFIIQGNSITQYSSMNPERYEATYRIDGDELRAKLIDGMDLTVKIDFANQRLDYGDGNWMHKTSSSDSDYSSSSSSSSLTTEFQGVDNVVGYLANHTFTDGSGLDIRFDSNGGIYIDNDYAGVVSVLTYNSTSALLRYRGGAYGEGKIAVTMDGNGRMRLTDPADGTVWYQK